MSRITYSSLGLKINNQIKTFDYNNKTIEVRQYLPIRDKYDLIMITLQKSIEGEIYNPIKLDMFFHLHLVYMYSNITFTDKQREDEEKLYDTLENNDIINSVIANMPEGEYEDLWEKIQEVIEVQMKYNLSAAAVIKSIIQDLPAQAQAAADIVNNFDPEKYQAVTDFAKAANGGRPIE